MCYFFSFVTEPKFHAPDKFYLDWDYRKNNIEDENDSHSGICKHYGLKEDICNKYEYNPITKDFTIDQINSDVDDSAQAQNWVEGLNFKKIVKPLIVKPIVNPFELPEVTIVTDEMIQLLKDWDSVRDSVWWDSMRASVQYSVWDSVQYSVQYSVWDSVWASVRDSVWDSVWDFVGAYLSSFFDIRYDYDFSPAIKLWNMGIVASFDGSSWRLHSGKNAKIVYEWKKE